MAPILNEMASLNKSINETITTLQWNNSDLCGQQIDVYGKSKFHMERYRVSDFSMNEVEESNEIITFIIISHERIERIINATYDNIL